MKPKTSTLHCQRCGADWLPRKVDELPVQCPRCKSLSWNKPRKSERE